ESPSGELWIGAREGLFRIGLAETTVRRLHTSAVRSLAIGEGGRVLSGGEKGLFSTSGGVTTPLTLQGLTAPWIGGVSISSNGAYVTTAVGLFAEDPDGTLRAVPNGETVDDVATLGDAVFASTDPPQPAVLRFDATSHIQIEKTSSPVRRVLATRET